MTKILIVDDNKQNIGLMKDFVESWGYETELAFQGRDAIELAQKIPLDAVLLDVMLPGMSGYEVCRELKENDLTRNIPVIMVTALVDAEDRIHGYKVGADNFLTKPLPYNELKAMLENLLKKKRLAEKTEKRMVVAETFFRLMNVAGDKVGFADKDNRVMRKLANGMGLNEEQRERLLIIEIMDLSADLEQVGGLRHKARLLQNLNLGKWLIAVGDYLDVTTPVAMRLAAKNMIDAHNLGLEVEVALVLKRYREIKEENNGSGEAAIGILELEFTNNEQYLNIISNLKKVLEDEKILEEMKKLK